MRGRTFLRGWKAAGLAFLAACLFLYAVLRFVVDPVYLAPRGSPQFSDVTPRTMAEPAHLAQSACWADVDGDGNQDLFVANSSGPSRLWRNEGNANFTEVGATAGVSAAVREPMGCAFVDLDNDGDLDLFLTGRDDREAPNRVLRNDGRGRFSDVSATAGVRMPDIGAASSDWADYDGDGDYDGFVAGRWSANHPRPNALLHQVRPFVFENVATALGLADPVGPQNTHLGAWVDYDGDGDLDLLLAIDWWGVELYRQDEGAFRRVTLEGLPPATDATPGAPPNNPMGVAVGDYNNDGCVDFFITGMNLSGTTSVREEGTDLPSRLFRNRCNGTFSDVTREAGLVPTGVVEWSTHFVDYDNDGDLDLVVVAGNVEFQRTFGKRAKIPLVTALRRAVSAALPHSAHLSAWASRNEMMIPPVGSSGFAAAMPNFLYRNQLVETGRPTFVDVTHQVGVADLGATRGSAWADVDNDGDLDWFVPNLKGPNRLFRNDGPVGHHLRVHLVGARLRDAVGAAVKIRVGDRFQYRHVHVLDGYLSQSQMDPHFGLGLARQVDAVWVRWPGSTQWVLACSAVAADRAITIREGAPGCR